MQVTEKQISIAKEKINKYEEYCNIQHNSITLVCCENTRFGSCEGTCMGSCKGLCAVGCGGSCSALG